MTLLLPTQSQPEPSEVSANDAEPGGASPTSAASPKAALPKPVALVPGLALSIAGGLAQTLAWPRFGLWPLTFLCLIPLWRAIFGQTFSRAFLFGWVYGLALGLSGFYWLAEVMAGYGGLGTPGGIVVLLILAAFLALHQGLWAGLMAPYSIKEAPLDGRVLGVPLLGAFLWAGFDYLKNFIFTGFNWTPLAGGLSDNLAFIGAADLIGIYGLGLPVALVSLLLAQLIAFRAWPKRALASTVSAILIAAVLYGYGAYRLGFYPDPVAPDQSQAQAQDQAQAQAQGQAQDQTQAQAQGQAPVPDPHPVHNGQGPGLTKTVAILQASVPQDQKWDARFRDDILERFQFLLKSAELNRPWLIVWPETAVPFIYGLDPVETRWMDETLGRHKSAMLVGLAAGDYTEEGVLKLHNRAWLVSDSQVMGSYDKSHLVPFGEYVPLSDVLPFLQWPFLQGVLGAAGTYSPGIKKPPMVLDGLKLGQLICFESLFPYMVRERAKDGANLLVVTTNDAWFGLTMAPDQHLAHSVMRATEARLPLVRAANNGISAIIAPSGRVLHRSVQNDIRALVWPVTVPQDPPQTAFTRGGHFLSPLMGLATALFCLIKLWRAKFPSLPDGPAERKIKKRFDSGL
ncbi:MAG: apolipoprotein N-acyltransferase [Deltaproteobacteria bacterium]|jgi:apolipoprotein N-acyltransferase|nr:apolipoprotein N-acyltransferase [Deltaproteobacteria bacterium]